MTPTRPSQAQIAIVFQGPEGKLLAVVTTMVWHDGDWKYVFPPDGTPAMQVIADLTGYVPWSASDAQHDPALRAVRAAAGRCCCCC